MNLHDFTDEQIAFLCREFHLTPNDLFYLSEREVQKVYDHLCAMEDEMATEILAVMVVGP